MFNSFPMPKPDIGGITIKSIQNGLAVMTATSKDIPISLVDMSKSIIIINPTTTVSNANNFIQNLFPLVDFINNTTIRLTMDAYFANVEVAWQVIEFNNVKSLQRGSATLGATTVTATISSVNVAKAVVVCSIKNNIASQNVATIMYASYISNPTTITIRSMGSGGVVNWQVIEFP